MSLYGINAYTSNYNSIYSGLYNSNKNKNSFGASSSDLLDLAKKVDLVRSSRYRNATLDEYKKILGELYGEKDNSSSSNPAKISSSASALGKSASNLLTEVGDFSDTDKTLSAIQSFVDNYNSTLDAIQSSDNTSILEKGVSMVNTTKAYSRTLERAGIFIGSDNRLTVKEDNVKIADPGALKALFSGSYSYASKIADKASYVSRASALQSQLTYNSKGNSSNMWDYYGQFLSNLFSNKV